MTEPVATNDNVDPVIRLPAPITPNTVLGVEISSRGWPIRRRPISH